jgi:hypothetical protein
LSPLEREGLTLPHFKFLYYGPEGVQEIWPAGKGKVIMYTFGALLLKLVEQCYHGKSDQAWTVESGASVYIHPWQKDVLNQLVRTNRVEEILDRVLANKSNIGDIDFAIVDTGAKVLDDFEEVPLEFTNCETRGLPVPDVQTEGLDEITYELDKETHRTLHRLQFEWRKTRRIFTLVMAKTRLEIRSIGTSYTIMQA